MKIIIKLKNLDLTEDLQNFVEEKFNVLKKFINLLKTEDEMQKTLAEVIIEIEKETSHHKKGQIFMVKAMVYLPGRNLIAEVKADDLFGAVIVARDELKTEIERYKLKKIDKSRRKARVNKK